MKGNVDVVIMKIESRCLKFKLPSGKCVDVLSEVFDEIGKYLQNDYNKPESGGYIIGYKHKEDANITLEKITAPQMKDCKSRVMFKIKDKIHNIILKQELKNKSYYMGVWHTHPEESPSPSMTDLKDWVDTLYVDKTGCEYAFFIIAGTKEFRIWIGDFKSKKIIEIYEWEKINGVYKKS